MSNKNYKVYVVGLAVGYASWIQGHTTRNMEEADVVLFTGGEDISPKIYGEERSRTTHIWDLGKTGYSRRDIEEMKAYEEAKALGKPMWGTCRGAQLLCALAGGKLVQDLDHPGGHMLYFYDREFECHTNSLHHQLQYPYTMKVNDDYKILAWSFGLSKHYSGGTDKNMHMPEIVYRKGVGRLVKEPEFVYYPKLKALGIQGHPEMMGYSRLPQGLVSVCHAYLNLLIEGYIDDVFLLNLKVKDVIDRAWDFKFTEEEIKLLESLKSCEMVEKVQEVEVEESK